MLKQIITVLMFVKEINSSKQWYQKFLSIEPVEDLVNFTSFKIGSIYLNLHLADALSPLSAGGTVVYWNVEDLQATLSKAREMGGMVYRGPLYVKLDFVHFLPLSSREKQTAA